MAKKLYIDGTRHVKGRLASYVAKAALEGKEVIILNSEKVVLTGSKSFIVNDYKHKIKKVGYRHKGPFWPKRPDDIVRRAVKRMLPYKKPRGSKAFKRVKAYIGVPKEFSDVKMSEFKEAKLHEDEVKFITVGDLSKEIGGFNG